MSTIWLPGPTETSFLSVWAIGTIMGIFVPVFPEHTDTIGSDGSLLYDCPLSGSCRFNGGKSI